MADKRYKSRVWFVLIMAGTALLILIVASNSKTLGIGGFAFLGLIILARFIMDFTESRAKMMMKAERRAIRGAKAEETIGSLLENLGDDYWVMHDIPSPYGNVDHVVIGKHCGIFLLETKAHGGRVSVANGRLLVNGHEPEKDFVAQALKNTYWLRDEIRNAIHVESWITPVVVFTSAFVEGTAPVKGVRIINKKYLLGLLQKPNARAQNLPIWENRERIQEALYASDRAFA